MKELDTYIVSFYQGNIEDLFEWLFENFGNSWGFMGQKTEWSYDFILFNEHHKNFFYDYLKKQYGWFSVNYTQNRILISDKNMRNHKEIYMWLLDNIGEQRLNWDFEMSITMQKLFVFFENVVDAIHFKMRWEEGS
jgi:hypothetical protein